MNTEEIQKSLLELCKIDQDVRSSYIKTREDKYLKQMQEVDIKSTVFMKEVLEKFGFPTISKVGKDSAKNAWLLIQHSPDFSLMEKYLELMELNINDINKKDYAMLKDRVLLQQGKQQIYGTQFKKNEKGEYVPNDLFDIENVDVRRREMGLDTLEENIQRMKKMYG